MRLKKIISGGQTGADQAGLAAAKFLGLETGGFCPIGWLTDEGPRPELLKSYGLSEYGQGYVLRTWRNARSAPVTLWFGRVSPGYNCTHTACYKAHTLFKDNPTAEEIRQLAELFEIFNVAGNRERLNRGIFRRTYNTLIEALEAK